MKCPACKGKGEFRYQRIWICHLCEGSGNTSFFKWIDFLFWAHMPDWVWDVYNWLFSDVIVDVEIKHHCKAHGDESEE